MTINEAILVVDDAILDAAEREAVNVAAGRLPEDPHALLALRTLLSTARAIQVVRRRIR